MTEQLASGVDRIVNSPRQVLFASLIGTAIEYFDFYIYASAAVLVFPRLFFPSEPSLRAQRGLVQRAALGGPRRSGSLQAHHLRSRRHALGQLLLVPTRPAGGGGQARLQARRRSRSAARQGHPGDDRGA